MTTNVEHPDDPKPTSKTELRERKRLIRQGELFAPPRDELEAARVKCEGMNDEEFLAWAKINPQLADYVQTCRAFDAAADAERKAEHAAELLAKLDAETTGDAASDTNAALKTLFD